MKTYLLTTLPKSSSSPIFTPHPAIGKSGDMAPIEQHGQLSLLPLLKLGSHIVVVILLTALVGNTIIRSYIALPPSQGTRQRQPARKSHVKLFSVLAILSFVIATYWAYSIGALSYQHWASERGVELPESIFGDKGALRGGEHPGRLQLIRWSSETPIYQDTLEVVAERARRFWWGQQLDLASISWSMLLAIEGRRRNIPHLWAFLLLAHTVSLSFAQNLFYVTVLLTPVPLPRNDKENTNSLTASPTNHRLSWTKRLTLSKPEGWCPSPILYLLPLMAFFASNALIPFSSNTPNFMTVMLLSRASTFAPLILPFIVPASCGTVHVHPHDPHSAYTGLFRTISGLSFLLHGKSTWLALLYNVPDSHYHRHTLLHPFKQEHRSVLERSSTSVGKVLGAIGDHPAVGAVGWDVLLSGLSVGVWAATRGLDVQKMLAASGLYFSMTHLADSESINGEIQQVAEKAQDKVESLPTPSKRRPGRPKKSETPESVSHDEHNPSVSTRRRKSRKSFVSNDDHPYQPAEPVQIEGDEAEDEDLEAAALTWGLMSALGLGSASAGVFGAETTAR